MLGGDRAFRLHRMDHAAPGPRALHPGELAHPIVNIDAGWAYRKSPLLAPQGAHSDFFYEESIHLLLTLAGSAR